MSDKVDGMVVILGVRLNHLGEDDAFDANFAALSKLIHKRHQLLMVDSKMYICVDSMHFGTRKSFNVDVEDSTFLVEMMKRNKHQDTEKHLKVIKECVEKSSKFEMRSDCVGVHMCFTKGMYE